MPITIESPTAEAIWQAAQQLPQEELSRLKQMFSRPDYGEGYADDWSEEDLSDLDRATAQLIDERFGPEEGNYD